VENRVAKKVVQSVVVFLGVLVLIAGQIAIPAWAHFTDPDGSTGNSFTVYVPTCWTQTSQADFEAGVLNQVDTSTSSGNVLLETTGDWYSESSSNWYDSNWGYRRAITITNTGGALSDYQVQVILPYDSDMQTDFDDIRIADSDEDTLLDHWRVSYTASGSATFWINVPSIPASGSKTIYAYYGNASASSASDKNATMNFLETGQLTLSSTIDGGVSQTVNLTHTYSSPAVVAYIATRGGAQSIDVRVRSVGSNSFNIFDEEPDDQGHATETNNWIVAETGSWIGLDGQLRIEAGTHSTSSVHTGGSAFGGDTVNFATSFASTPSVLATLNTYNSGSFMSTHTHGLAASNFVVQQESAESGMSASNETIGWIGFARNSGTNDGVSYDVGYQIDSDSDGVTDSVETIAYSFSGNPSLVIQGSTGNGTDGYWARGGGTFNSTSASFYAEEDQVGDTERAHANEGFSWAAFYPQGSITVRKYSSTDPTTSVGAEAVYDPWTRRVPVTIDNTSGGGLTDYQVQVALPYDSDMQADFDDIRFTTSDATTAISHWRESYVASGTATFWVVVPSVPASGTTSVYAYYGNSAASNVSDGDATFVFFDDFEDDLSKWTRHKTSGVYPRIESGELVCGGGSTTAPYGHTVLGSDATYSGFQNGIIEGKVYLAASGIAEVSYRGNYAANTGYKSRMDARAGEGVSHLIPPYSGWGFISGCGQTGTGITAGAWLDYSIQINSTSLYVTCDGQTRACTDSTYSGAGEISLQNHYGSYSRYDDVRVRKYASTEPTTSIGGEEGTYYSSGTIASQVLDTGISGAIWNCMFWDESLPVSTDITFEVRASDTSFLKDAASPSWVSVGGSSPVYTGLPSGRYKQWRATLTTSDVSQTPTLQEVRVYYY